MYTEKNKQLKIKCMNHLPIINSTITDAYTKPFIFVDSYVCVYVHVAISCSVYRIHNNEYQNCSLVTVFIA